MVHPTEKTQIRTSRCPGSYESCDFLQLRLLFFTFPPPKTKHFYGENEIGFIGHTHHLLGVCCWTLTSCILEDELLTILKSQMLFLQSDADRRRQSEHDRILILPLSPTEKTQWMIWLTNRLADRLLPHDLRLLRPYNLIRRQTDPRLLHLRRNWDFLFSPHLPLLVGKSTPSY